MEVTVDAVVFVAVVVAVALAMAIAVAVDFTAVADGPLAWLGIAKPSWPGLAWSDL